MTLAREDREFLLHNIDKVREKLGLYTVKTELKFELPTPKEKYGLVIDHVNCFNQYDEHTIPQLDKHVLSI